MADNGADVYLNGAKLLADSAANHNPKYWNNQVPVPGNHTAFKQGEARGVVQDADCGASKEVDHSGQVVAMQLTRAQQALPAHVPCARHQGFACMGRTPCSCRPPARGRGAGWGA